MSRKKRKKAPPEWKRDDTVLFELLGLVMEEVPSLEEISIWNDWQAFRAEQWVAVEHLIASNNPVKRLPIPEHLKRNKRS